MYKRWDFNALNKSKEISCNCNKIIFVQEDQDRDTPEESNSLQFNGASARYHNPPAMANALPASAESSSWEIILVDRNYGNNGNGNNSLVSRGNNYLDPRKTEVTLITRPLY